MDILLAIIIFVLYLHMNKKVNANLAVPAASVEANALPQEYVGSFTKRIALPTPQIKAIVTTVTYTIRDLKALASAAKITNYSSMKKADLMVALAL